MKNPVMTQILVGMLIAAVVVLAYVASSYAERARRAEDYSRSQTAVMHELADENWNLGRQLRDKAQDNAELLQRNQALATENGRARAEIAELQQALKDVKKRPFNPRTASDVAILAQALATEAGPAATYQECRSIAQVMVNRLVQAGDGATILGVVTAPGQFTAVDDGRWLWATPTDAEQAAAYNAMARIDAPSFRQDVQFFCAVGHEDTFFRTSLQHVVTIGDTAFYRPR